MKIFINALKSLIYFKHEHFNRAWFFHTKIVTHKMNNWTRYHYKYEIRCINKRYKISSGIKYEIIEADTQNHSWACETLKHGV